MWSIGLNPLELLHEKEPLLMDFAAEGQTHEIHTRAH